MEQITKKDGSWYYGNRWCKGPSEAYSRFKKDYNAAMGKSSSLYLENLGKRKERISGFGMPHRWNNMPQREACFGNHKTRYRILGLVGVHYFRTIDLSDIPEMSDEEFDRWLEWALAKGSNALTLVGTHDKAGRTNKRLNARYR